MLSPRWLHALRLDSTLRAQRVERRQHVPFELLENGCSLHCIEHFRTQSECRLPLGFLAHQERIKTKGERSKSFGFYQWPDGSCMRPSDLLRSLEAGELDLEHGRLVFGDVEGTNVVAHLIGADRGARNQLESGASRQRRRRLGRSTGQVHEKGTHPVARDLELDRANGDGAIPRKGDVERSEPLPRGGVIQRRAAACGETCGRDEPKGPKVTSGTEPMHDTHGRAR